MSPDPEIRQDSPFALSAKHSISVLFGDYWCGRDEGVPSSVLVRLLEDFGFSEHGSRAGLRGLVRDGVLRTWRDGRTSIYGPTPWTIVAQLRVAREACRPDPTIEEWDAAWTVLTFSASHRSGTARNALRRQLRVLGLRPLYPGVWVAPSDRTEEVAAEMDYRGVDEYSVFVTHDAARRRPFTEAWSTEDIDKEYRAFLDEFAGVDPTIKGPAALVIRSRVMDAWRLRRHYDPGLPVEVLPIRHGEEARAVFSRLYDGLRAAAESHVREVTESLDPTAAARIWSYASTGEHIHPAMV